jgi:hypothetical protein
MKTSNIFTNRTFRSRGLRTQQNEVVEDLIISANALVEQFLCYNFVPI